MSFDEGEIPEFINEPDDGGVPLNIWPEDVEEIEEKVVETCPKCLAADILGDGSDIGGDWLFKASEPAPSR